MTLDRRERRLLTAAAVVLLATVAGVVALADVDEDPGRVGVDDLDIRVGVVTGETATFETVTRLSHRGGTAENVTVEIRVVDTDTGLLATNVTESVGTLREDRDLVVEQNVTVDREGGYAVRAIVAVDGRRRDATTKEVRGVGSLTPAYARTSLAFHPFVRQPSIQYAVDDVAAGSVAIEATAYLTNQGDDASARHELALRARQAESNVVTDETRVTVDPVAPGRTATPNARLVVPAGYNYYIDAVLWKDGVIVAEARTAANLDPTETISANATVRDTGFQVGDFERDELDRLREELEHRQSLARNDTSARDEGQPGFGVALAVLVAAAVAVTRRHAR